MQEVISSGFHGFSPMRDCCGTSLGLRTCRPVRFWILAAWLSIVDSELDSESELQLRLRDANSPQNPNGNSATMELARAESQMTSKRPKPKRKPKRKPKPEPEPSQATRRQAKHNIIKPDARARYNWTASQVDSSCSDSRGGCCELGANVTCYRCYRARLEGCERV